MVLLHWRLPAALLITGALAACGGQATTSGSSSTSSPTPAASATATPAVMAQTVGTNGTILVAGSNGMTLYTFTKDAAGVSNCKGGCATTWPPLTVPAGQTPSGGTGVSGTLATITRDDGSLQVTYKGLPLYFFHSDSKPGDTNGHYTNWELVTP
jgi:predicted lipoprotein with Yx(FWY)xxD motif